MYSQYLDFLFFVFISTNKSGKIFHKLKESLVWQSLKMKNAQVLYFLQDKDVDITIGLLSVAGIEKYAQKNSIMHNIQ